MKILTLYRCEDAESPEGDCGQWTLYSFHRRSKYRSDDFFPDGKPTIGLRRKLAVGTAFTLDYYEHSGSLWSLADEGPRCQWDTVRRAGLLVWEHPLKELGSKTLEARKKDAQCFLDMYNCWANGEVYGYSVEEVVTLACGHTETELIDSCGGFYDLEYMSEQTREAIGGDPEVKIKGEAKDLAAYHDFVSPLPQKAEGEGATH